MCIHAADGEYMYASMYVTLMAKICCKVYYLCAINKLGFIPANMGALTQFRVGVGLPSTTLAQHQPDIGSVSFH